MTILKYLTSTVEGRLSMGEKDGGFGTTGIRADGDFHVVCDTVPDLPTGTVPQHNRLAESNAAERQDYLGINTIKHDPPLDNPSDFENRFRKSITTQTTDISENYIGPNIENQDDATSADNADTDTPFDKNFPIEEIENVVRTHSKH
ncbi:hypothetical protein OUZ56_033233 [Daphnia magna]|uniref:Uncharacterized protein n=1 Tax=Daphnia magna TaxID=35525 RepID=A0ABQ9ZXG5_9CRUS|nr:hypothetical protein OUZ56_033233 [Daphnia magna]